MGLLRRAAEQAMSLPDEAQAGIRRMLGAVAESLSASLRGHRPLPLAIHLDLGIVAESSIDPGWDAALAALPFDGTGLPPTVPAAHGPIRTVDLVNIAIAQCCAALLSQGGRPDRKVLASATRTLATALADKHPGRSIEVRVPPTVAVQIGTGTGPVHTRGTPPNVIETDPATFVRLATGLAEWTAELAAHRVSASGAAADLTDVLPLSRSLAP